MKGLGIISIVTVGLLAVLQTTTYLGFVLSSLSMNGDTGLPLGLPISLALGLLPAAFTLAVGLLLIANRESFASRWFPASDVSINIDAPSLLRVFLLAAGTYMVVWAMPSFIDTLVSAVIFGTSNALADVGIQPGFLDGLTRAIPFLIEIVLGVFLVVRSESLAAWLWRGRTVAVEPAVPALPTCPSCGEPYDPSDYQDPKTAKCAHCKASLQ